MDAEGARLLLGLLYPGRCNKTLHRRLRCVWAPVHCDLFFPSSSWKKRHRHGRHCRDRWDYPRALYGRPLRQFPIPSTRVNALTLGESRARRAERRRKILFSYLTSSNYRQ